MAEEPRQVLEYMKTLGAVYNLAGFVQHGDNIRMHETAGLVSFVPDAKEHGEFQHIIGMLREERLGQPYLPAAA